MVYDSNWALLEDYTFPGTTIPAWLGSPYSGSTGQLPAGDWTQQERRRR